MRSYPEGTEFQTDDPILRLDSGHAIADRHADGGVLRSGRVRQVLVGAERGRRVHDETPPGEPGAALHLCAIDEAEVIGTSRGGGRVLRRFRDNLNTLTHIARDPLLCYAEQGAVLSDLRETLYLTESALRQVESTRRQSRSGSHQSETILAIANVVEDRVDQLFERMERLTGLRQTLFRMSAILNGITCSVVPRVHEMDELTTAVVDSLEDGEAVTLLDADSPERTIRLAAHALNVAQVVARLAGSVPNWAEELSLAVGAALVADLGMIQVPDDVLDSPELLTPPQRVLVQKHPAASVSIVSQMRGHDERLIEAVYQHHERLDGSGYPERVRGEAVGPVARLLAVADSFVGMQSRRPYRPALSAKHAMVEIERAAAEGRLDPAWTCRLREIEPHWLKIPIVPEPPASAPAVSALAA